MTSLKVAVVDGDDISRRGMADLLADHPRVESVQAITPAAALRWSQEWRLVDVLLVDPVDESDDSDQFPGIEVIERARLTCSSNPPLVVATSYFFDEALMRRVWEARADFAYPRRELGDVRRLYDAVFQADTRRSTSSLPRSLDVELAYGVTAESRVNKGVSYALASGIVDALAGRSYLPTRTWQRLRREFNREARLSPITADGRPPERAAVPSRRQLSRFLAWATTVKPAVAFRPKAMRSFRGTDSNGGLP